MHILQATSEFYPYSKTGGLADMVAGLSSALADMGHEVTIVTPLHKGIRDKHPELKSTRFTLRIPMGRRTVKGLVRKIIPRRNLTVLFVDQPKYYDREGIYMENGMGYPDNPERFIFFSKAIVQIASKLRRIPDVIHCHDWQTGLIPLLLQNTKGQSRRTPAGGTCLSIHNLAYQGVCDAGNYRLTNLPRDYFTSTGVEFYGQLNFKKAGLVFADQLTTVSPQYATEIMTPEFGEGLDGVLRQRVSNLSGILNGVDYTQWRTAGNPHLHFDYSPKDLSGKIRNKIALLGEFGLPRRQKMPPLYAYIGRLADQKGVDIIIETIPRWLTKSDLMFVLLGNGDPCLEDKFRKMQTDFPNSVCCHIDYNEPRAHLIEAASDFFLMPSRFEPCGLNQLYSMRYGTIPIVNDVGGLCDTVIDVVKNPRTGNGFKLVKHSPDGLMRTLRASAKLYDNRVRLNRIRKRAMRTNFEWKNSAKAYLRIYKTCNKRR